MEYFVSHFDPLRVPPGSNFCDVVASRSDREIAMMRSKSGFCADGCRKRVRGEDWHSLGEWKIEVGSEIVREIFMPVIIDYKITSPMWSKTLFHCLAYCKILKYF